MVSEDSEEVRTGPWKRSNVSSPRSFLLIVRTGRIVTFWFRLNQPVAPDTRGFQHIAKFYNGLKSIDSEPEDKSSGPCRCLVDR